MSTQFHSDDISTPHVEEPVVAVLVPCYNEEAAINDVVATFRKALPAATVYVYDNNSNDRTVEVAKRAGAVVRSEPLQGKGNVVRRMFSDIDADIYLMVDGDGTYDAASAGKLIDALVTQHLDMVVGTRLHSDKTLFRPGHHVGNKVLTEFVGALFGKRVTDMLSGYRAMTRRFVKSFPALAGGFETETELTIHALSMRVPMDEVPMPFFERSEGSLSKLSTFKDGWRILKMIIYLFKEIRPMLFFSMIFAFLTALSLILVTPVLVEYSKTGLVPRFPTAILAASTMLLAFLCLTSGIILDSVRGARWEAKRLAYLAQPPSKVCNYRD
jgi:glycosyltransferase involved in cell wall biosynthesis